MNNKNNKTGKAKLFNIRRLPMDIGRILCFGMPLWFHIKKIYVNEATKDKIKNGALIAGNHTCFMDPLLLGSCFWYRRMFFLAAEVVMQHKLIRLPLKGIGCIEINRNICDVDAIRKSVSLLKEGHVMAVFPQGGIDRADDVKAIKSGIILMALQAKVPIIPVYIYRKTKFWERNCVVIGEPVNIFESGKLPGINDIQSYADYLFDKMTECKNLFEKTRRETNGKN